MELVFLKITAEEPQNYKTLGFGYFFRLTHRQITETDST